MITPTYHQESTPDPAKYLSAASAHLLKVAFSYDGFVAGGFAHLVTKYARIPNIDVKQQVDHYLGTNPLNNDPLFNAGRGDIDIFFPNKHALDCFMDMVRGAEKTGLLRIVQDYPGYFTEVFVDEKHRFQIVHRTDSVTNTLNGFDIYNGMVAFDGFSSIIPNDWHALIHSNMLHVYNWHTSPLIINRLSKWVRKHRYSKLSPKTAAEIGDAALACVIALKEKPWKPQWAPLSKVKSDPVTADKVLFILRQFMPHMTNDQLLLLTGVYPIEERDGYGDRVAWNPFTILRERAKF